MLEEKEILIDLIEECTILGKPLSLLIGFHYHPETDSSSIREVIEGRNDRIKELYYRVLFGDKRVPLDPAVTDVLDCVCPQVTRQPIADFVHVVGNNSKAFIERPRKTVYPPMDFAIAVWWKAIIKAIFLKGLYCDLLNLVQLSNSFRMLLGEKALRKDDVETKAQTNAFLNQASGKIVEVCGTISRYGGPIMEVNSPFLYRGNYPD